MSLRSQDGQRITNFPNAAAKIVEQYQKEVSQRKIAKSLKLSSTEHYIIQRFGEFRFRHFLWAMAHLKWTMTKWKTLL